MMSDYRWFDLGYGRRIFRRVSEPPPARSDLPMPYTQTDRMDPVEHPSDGRLYDSKSAFRRVTRANGCIEVGNDPARLRPRQTPKPAPDKRAIRDALQRAAAQLR